MISYFTTVVVIALCLVFLCCHHVRTQKDVITLHIMCTIYTYIFNIYDMCVLLQYFTYIDTFLMPPIALFEEV